MTSAQSTSDRADEALTSEEVSAFLADRYGTRAGRVDFLAAGGWSRAYAFTLDGQPRVARFGARGDDFAKDRVMGEAADRLLPIPRVLELGPAPRGYFVVAERVSGTPVDNLDEAGMRATLPSLLSTLDAIRDFDVSGTTGIGCWAPDETAPQWSWRDYLMDIAPERDSVADWWQELASSPVGTKPFEIGLERLDDLTKSLSAQRHLLHGDLLQRNVFVAAGRVSAVIDWGNAFYGDYLYDAALLIYWWPQFSAWRDIDIRQELYQHWRSTDGRLPVDVERRLLAYQLHLGLDAMAFATTRNMWDDVADAAQRVLDLAGLV